MGRKLWGKRDGANEDGGIESKDGTEDRCESHRRWDCWRRMDEAWNRRLLLACNESHCVPPQQRLLLAFSDFAPLIPDHWCHVPLTNRRAGL